MNQITKRLEQAVAAARAMTADQQDLMALEMLERVQSLSLPAAQLTAEERAELEAELAESRRGKFASDSEVAAMYARLGV